MNFEKCMEIMTKCFNTLHKDPDQSYSDQQKVERLLKAIKCQGRCGITCGKAIINQQFPCDYVGTCGNFTSQVAQIHGPAQLEYQNSRNKKHSISAVDNQSGRGSRGQGLLAIMVAKVVSEEADEPKQIMLSMESMFLI
jgi:hypothetical protein